MGGRRCAKGWFSMLGSQENVLLHSFRSLSSLHPVTERRNHTDFLAVQPRSRDVFSRDLELRLTAGALVQTESQTIRFRDPATERCGGDRSCWPEAGQDVQRTGLLRD